MRAPRALDLRMRLDPSVRPLGWLQLLMTAVTASELSVRDLLRNLTSRDRPTMLCRPTPRAAHVGIRPNRHPSPIRYSGSPERAGVGLPQSSMPIVQLVGSGTVSLVPLPPLSVSAGCSLEGLRQSPPVPIKFMEMSSSYTDNSA